MSRSEARQIVADGLDRKRTERTRRDAELERQERMLRETINNNHLVKTITEEQQKRQAKEEARQRRATEAKRKADLVAREQAVDEAFRVYGFVCLAIILASALTRLNIAIVLTLILGVSFLFAVYIYRIVVPFEKIEE